LEWERIVNKKISQRCCGEVRLFRMHEVLKPKDGTLLVRIGALSAASGYNLAGRGKEKTC